jgi:putative NADPH-quinone reductase
MNGMHSRRVLVLVGHPDPAPAHLARALSGAYTQAACKAGHQVHTIDMAQLEVPLLRSAALWRDEPVPPQLAPVQQALLDCEHLLLVFPLWMGDMPAMLKALIEQVARPGFAFPRGQQASPFGPKALAGRSARVVVTMGMPAPVYRHFYRAHSVKALERNILGFVGFAPVRETLIGNVDGADGPTRLAWLVKMARLGAKAA